ncbi:hypothetical protein HanPSC8_Chr08g0331521 [Helianthus annuus]|nr:hypothetical protein HanPSC8_Chr08g0331521 [Helianthus annuus]
MLTCITCTKQQVDDEGQEMGARGSKDAVKNLTTQVVLFKILYIVWFYFLFLFFLTVFGLVNIIKTNTL